VITWPITLPMSNPANKIVVNDPGGSRTRDLRIKSPLLYQLSYRVGDGSKFAQRVCGDNSSDRAPLVSGVHSSAKAWRPAASLAATATLA
jgi:hypothetical protein